MAILGRDNNSPANISENTAAKPQNHFLRILLVFLFVICMLVLCIYGIMRHFGIVIRGDYICFGVDYDSLEKHHDYFNYEIWIPDAEHATNLNTITTMEINGEPWDPNAPDDPWENIRLLHTQIEDGPHKCFRVLSGWTEEPIIIEVFVYQFYAETGEKGTLIKREIIRITPSLYKYHVDLLEFYHNPDVNWEEFATSN